MLTRGEAYGAVSALLVIGGHSVAVALMDRQIKTAFLQCLGVAGCVLIFGLLNLFMKFFRDKSGD